ncbi:SPFH domain-containing protein [Engelhardtia mirabilis]|uniref:SPFH domain / Band 7 family protein n=1 Tax=Engelhardtia mirabilis TaxID=2528011 RepID=A0A518BHS6_9BACT|nr:SPFH domain / Band 7 family protein [Planctomycetes bacterium Pla133]QDV00842.1 SPFH domain / Band 7 family protein [Planctomycetes bacterium Pla86]
MSDQIPDVFPPEGLGGGDPPRRGPRPTSGGGGGPRNPGVKLPIRAVVALALLFMLFTVGGAMAISGRLGFTTIDPEEVAVKVNYLTGKTTVINQPGYQIFLPFAEEIFKLDRTFQSFEMRGNEFVGQSVVPKLTVRANDGSNFRFEFLSIQYALVPSAAAVVLAESGPGDGFKAEWIKAHARSILRDEFGRYTAEEIADPAKLQTAFAAGKRRLDLAVQPFGLRVIEIPQSRPNFDDEYEQAIEERKVTDQDVERLVAMEDQLLQEREQQLAQVEREKSIEMESLKGDLEKARLGAERDAIQQKKSADAYALERVADGQAERAQLLAKSRGLTERYTKEAEGVEARATALAERGEVVVREAIIDKLRQIRFTFVPYSRDPAPQRLEHSGDAGGSDASRKSSVEGN